MAREFRCSTCGTTVKYGTPACPECGKQFRYEAAPKKPTPPVFPVRETEQPPQPTPNTQHPTPNSQHATPKTHSQWKWAVAGFAAAVVLFAVIWMVIPKSRSGNGKAVQADSLQTMVKNVNPFGNDAAEAEAVPQPASADPDDVSHLPGPKVAINGEGVRMRFAPSLDAGYLVWEDGHTRSVPKGTQLRYLGETKEWFKVKYKGKEFYVSKQYSYKVK